MYSREDLTDLESTVKSINGDFNSKLRDWMKKVSGGEEE